MINSLHYKLDEIHQVRINLGEKLIYDLPTHNTRECTKTFFSKSQPDPFIYWCKFSQL